MKFRRGREDKEEVEINISSLIDLVFILLIFFLVSTAFVSESGFEASPSSGLSNREIHLDDGPIRFKLTSGEEIFYENQLISIAGVQDIVRPRCLKKEQPVFFQVYKGVRSGLLVSAMDEAILAGASSVKIESLN
tara:strand:- start:53 stop:457 length:405 start_codon:yes stop_codon:yes gene_type:complete